MNHSRIQGQSCVHVKPVQAPHVIQYWPFKGSASLHPLSVCLTFCLLLFVCVGVLRPSTIAQPNHPDFFCFCFARLGRLVTIGLERVVLLAFVVLFYIWNWSLVFMLLSPLVSAAPVAEWLRTLIFSALNFSSFHHCGFEPSSGHMGDKPSSVCRWSGGLLGDLPFSPHLTIESAQIEWNNLDGT